MLSFTIDRFVLRTTNIYERFETGFLKYIQQNHQMLTNPSEKRKEIFINLFNNSFIVVVPFGWCMSRCASVCVYVCISAFSGNNSFYWYECVKWTITSKNKNGNNNRIIYCAQKWFQSNECECLCACLCVYYHL